MSCKLACTCTYLLAQYLCGYALNTLWIRIGYALHLHLRDCTCMLAPACLPVCTLPLGIGWRTRVRIRVARARAPTCAYLLAPTCSRALLTHLRCATAGRQCFRTNRPVQSPLVQSPLVQSHFKSTCLNTSFYDKQSSGSFVSQVCMGKKCQPPMRKQ